MIWLQGPRAIASIFTGALLLGGCQTIENIAPVISDVVGPQDAATTGAAAPVSSTARIDRKGWGYANPYFTFAPNADSLFDNTVASVADADCDPTAPGSSLLDCEVHVAAHVGTWFYQWHLDYGQTGADTATLSRPSPATDTFTVTQVATPPPPVSVGGGPDVDEDETLVLFDPADGDRCAGTFLGSSVENGSTFVPVDWRADSTDEYQSLPGDYQIMVEHPDTPNCADEVANGLDLLNANAAWPYTSENGCWVTFTNINSTATEALVPHRDYRARVRRILPAGGFGDWTPYNAFQTASPPAQVPTFENPVEGGVVDMPDTVASQTVEFLWRMEDCEPTIFTLSLFRDEQTTPSTVIEGACGWNGDPFLCRAQAPLDRGASFRAELTQSNLLGSIETQLNFSTE